MRYFLKDRNKPFIQQLFGLKKRGVMFLFYLLFCVMLLTFFHHDYAIYQNQLIGKVISVKNERINSSNGCLTYKQSLKVKLLNGTNKGSFYIVDNTYTSSNVKSAKYHVKEQLLLKQIDTNHTSSMRIISLKRDIYFVYLFLFFMGLLLLFVGKRTLFLLITFLGNMALYILNLFLYQKGIHLGILTCLFMILQTFFTLYVLNGRTSKVRLTVCSSLLSILATCLIYMIILKCTKPLPYYMFDYLSVSDTQKQNLFMASVLFGGLGAVMDVCITICSMAGELDQMKKQVSLNAFFKSLSRTSTDIIGTMQCVLLFSYLTSAIPMMTMKLASGAYFISVLKFDFSFELVRFLTGAIAIVLAAIFSTYICTYFYYGIRRHKNSFFSMIQLLHQENVNEKKALKGKKGLK